MQAVGMEGVDRALILQALRALKGRAGGEKGTLREHRPCGVAARHRSGCSSNSLGGLLEVVRARADRAPDVRPVTRRITLPVTEDERLVGMITHRDITTRVVAESAVPETKSVEDVYSRELISVEPDKGLEEALQLMARHQLRRLPVVENGRLVGMVAQADIALKENERTGELVGAISEPSEEERR